MNTTPCIKAIKEDVTDKRDTAKLKAQRAVTCVRSRGAILVAIGSNPDVLGGAQRLNEGDESQLTTKKGLEEFLSVYEKKGATEIFVDGGFDGASSVRDLNESNYTPWVSEWSIKIWDKEKGFIH